MKKIYLLFSALTVSLTGFGQTIPNGDMAAWRTSTAGGLSPKTIQAPIDWFGLDSTAIADEQALLLTTTLGPQVFEESTITFNGAPHAAKVMTRNAGSEVGILPGFLTNANVSINATALLGGGSLSSAVTSTGGTPVTVKPTSVSAWVEYFPGLDTLTNTYANDTGLLTVEAYAIIGGVDSLIGSGETTVTSSSAYEQITAAITYTDNVDSVGLLRIFFASSGGGTTTNDSSTMYIDSVTMASEAEPVNREGVKSVTANQLIKIYPNPASDVIYIESAQNAGLTCSLSSVTGTVVAAEPLTGNNAMSVSDLPAGVYVYTISDKSGNAIQKGKISVVR